MDFDQKRSLVFCVKRGNAGKWNVMEAGVEKPLASFDTKIDATEYAFDLVSTKGGSKLEIFNEHGTQTAEVTVGIFSEHAATNACHREELTRQTRHKADDARHVAKYLAEVYVDTAFFQQFMRH